MIRNWIISSFLLDLVYIFFYNNYKKETRKFMFFCSNNFFLLDKSVTESFQDFLSTKENIFSISKSWII